MKHPHLWSQGLTMVEVLIVMAIALPIMIAFMGAFNALSKTQIRNDELDKVQASMLTVMHDVTQDAHASDQVYIKKGELFDALTLKKVDNSDEYLKYNVIDGKLLKNNALLTQKDVEVRTFQVDDIAREGGIPLLHFYLSLASKKDPEVELTQDIRISLRQNQVMPSVTPAASHLTY